MNNIDLLPRADLPVIWNEFKTKADAVWSVAESLVVTDVSQKEAMALARKTRLTLRDIRIAVEHKRVELGEELISRLNTISEVLGLFPHSKIVPVKIPKTQTTRMHKCSCPTCDYTIRLTRKWMEVGIPNCPVAGHPILAEAPPEGEEGE